MVRIDAGLLNGSWRVALEADDQPLVYFDIFNDAGEATADGNFLMGMALGEMLDGEPGELITVEMAGDVVTVAWNPTTDEEEVYYLEATRVDADHFEGTFSAERNPREESLVMTRRVFEDDSDLEPFED